MEPWNQVHNKTFFFFLKATNDIQTAIERKSAEMGLTVQPFITFVSESLRHVPNCYVSIDKILYNIASPLKAVDVCFKSIHALNASYAPESTRIWMMLQKGVYNINNSMINKSRMWMLFYPVWKKTKFELSKIFMLLIVCMSIMLSLLYFIIV